MQTKSNRIAATIQCIAQTADVCGEGAVWHPAHNAVYWTDINRGLIHRYSLTSGRVDTWTFDQPVTALALTTAPGKLLVVLGGIILLWNPEEDHRGEILYRLPAWPHSRCNDARVDPAGTLWFGTMQNNVAPGGTALPITQYIGELISLNAAGPNPGTARTWQQGIGISNTLAWSPDASTMYFGDTLRNTIYAYDYNVHTQSIANQRIFTAGFAHGLPDGLPDGLPAGLPDGSAIDAEGYLWNCRYGGNCIVRFAPSGAVDLVVRTPIPNPTTCAFGGPDLSTLYFTSAGEGSQLAGPSDGGLFTLQPEIPGLPATPFALP